VTMYILDAILVQPLTRFTRSSLVGHIGGGRPDVFISHAWGGTFFNFLKSVLTHYYNTPKRKSKENTYYWVCTFGVNQHMADIEVGAGIYGPFWGGIQLSKEVIAIQDDKAADIWFTLGRGWCVWEMMVALMFKKPLQFVMPGGSMFGFNGLVTSPAFERLPHTALKRRLMGFAVKQASGGPEEAMNEIQGIICTKACEFTIEILNGNKEYPNGITKMKPEDKKIYEAAWTKPDADGLECFEDLFQIAGNLIQASNAADARMDRRGNTNTIANNEQMVKAAVGGLSKDERRRLNQALEEVVDPRLTEATGKANPDELDKVSDEMTKAGFLKPDSTGHCMQKSSECPFGAVKEKSKPAKVSDLDDMLADIKVEDSDSDSKGSLLQLSDLLQDDDNPSPKQCISGKKKKLGLIEDSEAKAARIQAQKDKIREDLAGGKFKAGYEVKPEEEYMPKKVDSAP